MDLGAVRTGAARGAATRKDERAAHPVVAHVGKIRKAFELGDRTGPQIVGALDHLGHIGRHLVRPKGEQVSTHRLVDAVLFACPHELDGPGADAILHPLAHPRRPDAGHLALGHLGHDGLDLGQLHLGVADRSMAEGGVDQHATVVDALVDVVVGQFLVGEGPHTLADLAHGPHVLLAVGHHLGHQGGVAVERAVFPGEAQQANELRATVVFPHLAGHGASDIFQTARKAVRSCLGCRTMELFESWFRHTYVRAEDVPKNQPVKTCVVKTQLPAGVDVVYHPLGERRGRRPRLNRLIVKGV